MPASFFDNLDKNYTHLFEMCCIEKAVVIFHEKDQLFYLTSIENQTGMDHIFPEIQEVFEMAQEFSNITSLEEALEFCCIREEDEQFEGLVLCDADFKRVKIKTVNYVTKHLHWSSDQPIELKYLKRLNYLKQSMLERICNNTADDYVSKLPEKRRSMTNVWIK